MSGSHFGAGSGSGSHFGVGQLLSGTSLSSNPLGIPPTVFDLSVITVSEDLAVGSLVARLSGNGDAPVAYTIVSDPDSKFVMDANGTDVLLQNPLDHSVKQHHDLEIEARNSAGFCGSTVRITVSVSQVVTTPPTSISPASASIVENASPGALVAVLGANGTPAAATFSIVSDPDDKFQIVGNQLQVRNPSDYETDNSHDVEIRADNGVGTHDQVITVSVTDVDETLASGDTIVAGPITATLNAVTSYKPTIGGRIFYVPSGTRVNTYNPFQSTDNGEVINGATLDHVFEGPRNWDGRSVYSSENGTQPTFPLTLGNNQFLIIGKSNLAIDPDTDNNHRKGVIEDYMVLIGTDTLPTGDVLAPHVIHESGRTNFDHHVIDVDAFIAALPKFTLPNNLPDIEHVKTFIDKLNIGMAISQHNSDDDALNRSTYEMWTPANSGTYNGSNYGGWQTSRIDAALLYMLMHPNFISDADRRLLTEHMLVQGEQLYGRVKQTGVVLRQNGAHFASHLAQMLMSLIVKGQTSAISTLIADTMGSFGGLIELTAQQAIDANAPHSDLYKFAFSRRRTINAVDGNIITLNAATQGDGSGDPNKFRTERFDIVRESDGASAFVTAQLVGGDLPVLPQSTIDAQPSPAFAPGETVWLRSQRTLVAGSADWALESVHNHSALMANAKAAYRELHEFSAQALMCKVLLDTFGIVEPTFNKLFNYCLFCNNSAINPVNDDYPEQHSEFTAIPSGNVPFVKTFWDGRWDGIFNGNTNNVAVLSNHAVSSIGTTSAQYDFDTTSDDGLAHITVNQTQTLPGDNDAKVALIKAGGGLFDDNYVLQPGDTGASFNPTGLTENQTYYIHVVQENPYGRNSIVHTETFQTAAEPPVGDYNVTFRGNHEIAGAGPYTFPPITTGTYAANRQCLVWGFARGVGMENQAIYVDGAPALELERTTFGPEASQLLILAVAQPTGSNSVVELRGTGAGRGAIALVTAVKANRDSIGKNINSSDQNYTIAVPNNQSTLVAVSSNTDGDGSDFFTAGPTSLLFNEEISGGVYHFGGFSLVATADASYAIIRPSNSNMHTIAVALSEAP